MTDYVMREDASSLFSDDAPEASDALPDMPETAPELAAEGDETESGENPASEAPETASEDADDADDQGEPEAPAIDPPAFWSEEKKAAFAKADPELQQYIVDDLKAKDAEVTRRQMEAADLRKQVQSVSDLAKAVGQTHEAASMMFAAKWNGVTEADWIALARENPEEADRLHKEMTDEKAALDAYKAQKEQAEAMSAHQWAVEQAEIVRREMPELTNPETMTKLVDFARSNGVTDEDLNGLSAIGLKILNMAFKGSIKPVEPAATEQPKETKAAVKPSLKPSAVRPSQPNQYSRFAADPSIENAAALFN